MREKGENNGLTLGVESQTLPLWPFLTHWRLSNDGAFEVRAMPELCSLDQSNHSFKPMLYLYEEMNSRSEGRCSGLLERRMAFMIQITDNPVPKLHKAPQPPLSHLGATPDSDRAKKPPLSDPAATDQELNPGDRVEG